MGNTSRLNPREYDASNFVSISFIMVQGRCRCWGKQSTSICQTRHCHTHTQLITHSDSHSHSHYQTHSESSNHTSLSVHSRNKWFAFDSRTQWMECYWYVLSQLIYIQPSKWLAFPEQQLEICEDTYIRTKEVSLRVKEYFPLVA